MSVSQTGCSPTKAVILYQGQKCKRSKFWSTLAIWKVLYSFDVSLVFIHKQYPFFFFKLCHIAYRILNPGHGNENPES